MSKTKKNRLLTIAYCIVLAGVALVASLPAFRSGVYKGFDLWFHYGRIESIATELQNGQFPVRYETTSWYGNGYISSITYGNIFLYIPAVLHLLGLPTYRCYNLYVILTNIAGVFIAFYSFSKLFKDKQWGFIATVIYMLSGYYISNVYMRAAVGEYTAMIFIPLVVYGIYRILFEKGIAPFVIGVSGIIQSHILTSFMVASFLLLFLIINWKDAIAKIKELVVSVVAILGINAFFIVPFLDSYMSYNFNIKNETAGINIRKYGLYIDQFFGLFPTGNGTGRNEWTSQGEGYLRIGVLHVICFLLCIVALVMIKKLITDKKLFLSVFALGCLAVWMSSAYFPWGIFSADNGFANIMRSVQYPSRYMLLQTICWTICGVYVIKRLFETYVVKHEFVKYAATVLIVGFVALAQTGVFMYTLSCSVPTVQTIDDRDNFADGLYLQQGTDTENLITEAIAIDNKDCIVEDLGYEEDTRVISINNASQKEAQVLVPVFNYKYIYAKDLSGKAYTLSSTDNNQYSLVVESNYQGKIEVQFKEPILWRVAEIISIASILALAAWSRYVRKDSSLKSA